NDDVEDALAEDRRDQNREQYSWECELHVCDPHERGVERSPEVARHKSHQHADEAGDEERSDTDSHRDPGPLQRLREKVLTDLVGAEDRQGTVLAMREGREQTVRRI